MSAARNLETTATTFDVLRLFNRYRLAGHRAAWEDGRLSITSASPLSDEQRADLRRHKVALVALLQDAQTLLDLLVAAGANGSAEGEPPGWDWERRYAALDVLISQGNARYVLGRYYLAECAPVADWEAYEERAAIMEFDGGLSREEAECKALAAFQSTNALPQAELDDGQRITPLSALVELSKSRTRQEFEEGFAKKRGGR